MRTGKRRHWLAHCPLWVAVGLVTLAVGPTQRSSHSLDLQIGTGAVCTDGAVFEATTTQASSLNLPMTSGVWDSAGTTVLATGDSHTFTAVPETFTFTVPYAPGTVSVGDLVRLSVSNDGTLMGTEGDVANGTVADCSITPVPTLPVWGTVFLTVTLLAAGMTLGRRSRGGSVRPATGI